ncbi:MAG: hypothetical protein RMK31_08380 [Candidatus Caldarchaeum sp.]|nr:hypothetical protein [Candidatus Caldarchaeum sp.]
MTEPCPFCGSRVEPRVDFIGAKKCPRCGGRWFEGGGPGGGGYFSGGGAGGCEAAAA